MLGDKRFIQTIRLRNLLSFGPESEEIELKSLNVLIGPNASGKSNFIEALNILRNTPNDIAKLIREGGGIGEYIWKGRELSETPTAEIYVTMHYPNGDHPIGHLLRFTKQVQHFEIVEELIRNVVSPEDRSFLYEFKVGKAYLSARRLPSMEGYIDGDKGGRIGQEVESDNRQSILARRKDPVHLPEITYLVNQYPNIEIYCGWEFGRDSAPRKSQGTDLPVDFLEDGTTGEVANNLALVVNVLQNKSGCWEPILERFKNFLPYTEKITQDVYGNLVRLMLHEKGLKESIPATRWSDGMLRYLSLLVILCHPEPPPLICIEEPELGMHPDILSDIAELLIEASHRTQLIITTHSDILVSELSEVPESILVCERDDHGTSMRRLQKEKLEEWLKKYTLGDLWMSGELGGTAY